MTPRDDRPVLRILGCRGIPAAHGGFETFAQRLALHLVGRGWKVVVYGQGQGDGGITEDDWQGVHRVTTPVAGDGPGATMRFDLRSIRHAARCGDPCLTLGYNTALLWVWLRLRGVPHAANMDGVEWRRAKWSWPARLWLRLNETVGCRLADHVVADHPAIRDHLARHTPLHKISTIAYGAEDVRDAPDGPLQALGLQSGGYATLIARPEPENGVLEIVRAFSCRPRPVQLAVVGRLDERPFHRAIRAAAGPQVRFLGPLYDPAVLASLRCHARLYLHGHRVGGTNPSLLEAMAAGNAVLAHDNLFNRQVVADGARYWQDEASLDQALTGVLADDVTCRTLGGLAFDRFDRHFRWDGVLQGYEVLLARMQRRPTSIASRDARPGCARGAGD